MLMRSVAIVLTLQATLVLARRSSLEIMFSHFSDPTLLDMLREETRENHEPPRGLPGDVRAMLWKEAVEQGFESGPLPGVRTTVAPPTTTKGWNSPFGDPKNPTIPKWMLRSLRHRSDYDELKKFVRDDAASAKKPAPRPVTVDLDNPKFAHVHKQHPGQYLVNQDQI